MLQELISLQQSGTLSKMVRAGLVSSKVNFYLEVYLYIDARKKTTGKKSNDLILEASQQFGVCRATVYNALQAIKS